MSLAAPKLDDRRFQDIVDEAKKRIPHYSNEWTDHNVSDPGITLIELFAWMTDIILYRLNQVPDRHYIKFMEMLGIHLKEPVPAKVPVSFWLSAPQEVSISIPAGTEVATTQTETEPSIVFTTDIDFEVMPPEIATIMTHSPTREQEGDEKAFRPLNLRRLERGIEEFNAFTNDPQPHPNDALYFGFSNDLSHHILSFEFECDDEGGAGIDPTLPPYIWEVSTNDPTIGGGWQTCDMEEDTTKGLNISGRMQIHLPRMDSRVLNEDTRFWVRLRVLDESEYQEEGMQAYRTSPRLRQILISTWGGTVPTTHAQLIREEQLGISDGSAGQRFHLEVTPILPRRDGETLKVITPTETELWTEVNDFADSKESDKNFTLDSVTGELRLGPAIRQRDGGIQLYGDIPRRNANLVFTQYRYGGGHEGNVEADSLNTLKTAIPFIDRVRNRTIATGGLDTESLKDAMERAPALLRARERAVTQDDFEFLAKQALRAEIGRVKCLQPRPSEAGRVAPGQVYVLVVPRVHNPAGYHEPEELEPSREALDILTTELNSKRLLTTRLDIRAPQYSWVAVRAQLRASPEADEAEVESMVLARLYQFLNPLTGGSAGTGWPFGRELYESDVYQCLQGMPNVQFIRRVELFVTTPGGNIQGNPVESVENVGHGTIASAVHEVNFV